jgi:hypothetical protein
LIVGDDFVRGAFDLEGRRKPQAFAAVAVIQAGIMDIECCFMVGQMILWSILVADGDGNN